MSSPLPSPTPPLHTLLCDTSSQWGLSPGPPDPASASDVLLNDLKKRLGKEKATTTKNATREVTLKPNSSKSALPNVPKSTKSATKNPPPSTSAKALPTPPTPTDTPPPLSNPEIILSILSTVALKPIITSISPIEISTSLIWLLSVSFILLYKYKDIIIK
ncbi:hypothetical protein TL16_g09571 [Triparma laevis f. inornata]|uniref:Uncharacterized protein n=2 Tax=Triparma laevis TaxID=1534972 RepID=A0A9W6ZQK3_9STRA|nr:hypothetical protein TrLO_g14343 [Triparma laevis f. longispina]GMH83360.1 hypothetical protein TL16_g09571 [Triparma laevis f. inornata]